MAPRTVEGPDRTWLTAAQAAAWLNIGRDTFLRHVEQGRIPHGVHLAGPQKPLWNWLDLVAFSHLEGRFSGKFSLPKPP